MMFRLLRIVVFTGVVVLCASCQDEQDPTALAPAPTLRPGHESDKPPAFNVETRFAAGRLAESEGHPDKALIQYNAALKLDPNHRDSLYRLGVIYAELRRFPEAITAWQRYITATGWDPNAYSNLGFCYELAGHLGEAETAYKDGLAKDAGNVACHVNYGLMLARHHRTPEAIAQLQAVLKPAEVHYNLASAYEYTGRLDEARAEYHKALDVDPHFTDAQVRLAALH